MLSLPHNLRDLLRRRTRLGHALTREPLLRDKADGDRQHHNDRMWCRSISTQDLAVSQAHDGQVNKLDIMCARTLQSQPARLIFGYPDVNHAIVHSMQPGS